MKALILKKYVDKVNFLVANGVWEREFTFTDKARVKKFFLVIHKVSIGAI